MINAAGNALLAPDVPTMARFVAGKVFHNLSRPSGFYRAGDPALPWCGYLGRALEGPQSKDRSPQSRPRLPNFIPIFAGIGARQGRLRA
ncbi:hypothetical protein AB395_00002715 [Sinorhizobium fredii CCBAU 45436]|nr:hypothetical protein AB395_00002715 [Sinorhizobium fredii CCBAU 45436]